MNIPVRIVFLIVLLVIMILILADKTYRLSCNLFYMYIYVFTFLLVDKDRGEEKHLLSKCKISVFVFTTCRKIF